MKLSREDVQGVLFMIFVMPFLLVGLFVRWLFGLSISEK